MEFENYENIEYYYFEICIYFLILNYTLKIPDNYLLIHDNSLFRYLSIFLDTGCSRKNFKNNRFVLHESLFAV